MIDLVRKTHRLYHSAYTLRANNFWTNRLTKTMYSFGMLQQSFRIPKMCLVYLWCNRLESYEALNGTIQELSHADFSFFFIYVLLAFEPVDSQKNYAPFWKAATFRIPGQWMLQTAQKILALKATPPLNQLSFTQLVLRAHSNHWFLLLVIIIKNAKVL